MRKSIYFSARLDKDIISYMEKHNFDEDFSRSVKQLMRTCINGLQVTTQTSVPVKPIMVSTVKLKRKIDTSELNSLLDQI